MRYHFILNQDIMYQKAMDSPVTIVKWVDEDKSK